MKLKNLYSNIIKLHTMKNWQEMKDFSYVGIKITKAKTISQGLTRCKIQKLSRKNPVYEHIILHKKYRPKSECQVCTNRDLSVKQQKQKSSSQGQTIESKRYKTEQVRKLSPRPDSSCEKKSCHYHNAKVKQEKEKILASTPRQAASRQSQRMKNAIDKFGKGMKKSKKQFNKISKSMEKTGDYFYTTVDIIDHQFNEDKGLTINQMRTENQKIKEEMNEHHIKLKMMQKKVSQLNRPIKFPFTTRQIINIVNADRKIKKSQTKKLNSMLTSIYDYKSKANYSNRMKIISSIIKK